MTSKRALNRNSAVAVCYAALAVCSSLRAQDAPASEAPAASSAASSVIYLFLDDAIKRANTLGPNLIAGLTNAKIAAESLNSPALAEAKSRAGMSTALEVVKAEATVSTERTAYYDAETRHATAIATLPTITGVL